MTHQGKEEMLQEVFLISSSNHITCNMGVVIILVVISTLDNLIRSQTIKEVEEAKEAIERTTIPTIWEVAVVQNALINREMIEEASQIMEAIITMETRELHNNIIHLLGTHNSKCRQLVGEDPIS